MATESLQGAQARNQYLGTHVFGLLLVLINTLGCYERSVSPGVYVYSMHPGWTTTEGVKKSIPGFYNFYKVSSQVVIQGL